MIKIIMQPLGPLCGDEQLQKNFEASEGLPRIRPKKLHRKTLAIVGGAPSIETRIPEIKSHDTVWGINHTYDWLRYKGIDADFITIDPRSAGSFNIKHKGHAYLASTCDPSMREHFDSYDLFDLHDRDPKCGIAGGTTTASRAICLGAHQGYVNIYVYGCDGSFDPKRTHVNKNMIIGKAMVVRANGEDYITNPQLYLGTQELAKMIGMFEGFRNCSDGLLTAMIEDDDFHVVAVNEVFKKHLEAMNGECVFNEPYGGIDDKRSQAVAL